MRISIEELTRRVEENKARSAWARGVKDYALNLLSNLEDYAEDGEINTDSLWEDMLDGADDWQMYSWGGCSLIYNTDIAERLCTPSEFSRTKGGEYKPNKQEEWLDVQTRALFQAAMLITRTAAEIR